MISLKAVTISQAAESDLVERCHPRHVDPVQVNVHAGSPQHVHDGVSVTLTNVILKHDLVWKADSSLARVEPREHGGSA